MTAHHISFSRLLYTADIACFAFPELGGCPCVCVCEMRIMHSATEPGVHAAVWCLIHWRYQNTHIPIIHTTSTFSPTSGLKREKDLADIIDIHRGHFLKLILRERDSIRSLGGGPRGLWHRLFFISSLVLFV